MQTCTTYSTAASVQMWPSTPRTSAWQWRLTGSSSALSATSSCCCLGWRACPTPMMTPLCSWHRVSLQWRRGIPSPHPTVVPHPLSCQSGWWWRILHSALVCQTSSTSFIQVPAGNRSGYSFPIVSWRNMCITLGTWLCCCEMMSHNVSTPILSLVITMHNEKRPIFNKK